MGSFCHGSAAGEPVSQGIRGPLIALANSVRPVCVLICIGLPRALLLLVPSVGLPAARRPACTLSPASLGIGYCAADLTFPKRLSERSRLHGNAAGYKGNQRAEDPVLERLIAFQDRPTDRPGPRSLDISEFVIGNHCPSPTILPDGCFIAPRSRRNNRWPCNLLFHGLRK